MVLSVFAGELLCIHNIQLGVIYCVRGKRLFVAIAFPLHKANHHFRRVPLILYAVQKTINP
jgi:hypothetical protein